MSTFREESVVFPCGSDQLVGIIHRAQQPRHTTGVLIVVGGPQYRVGSHRQFTLLARALAAEGFPVMRFDYRGMGDSDGEPRTFESIESDIRAASNHFVRSVPELSGLVLWGLCDAASAILMHAVDDTRVRGLILANPWVRTQPGEARAYLRHYYLGRLVQRAFWNELLSGRINPLRAILGLAENVMSARTSKRDEAGSFVDRMSVGMARFRGPILLLISERDLTAQEFMDLCGASAAWRSLIQQPNMRVERLAGSDHTFSQRESFDLAVEHSRRWLASLEPTPSRL